MDQLMTEILKIDKIAQEKIVNAKDENRKVLRNLSKKRQEIVKNTQKEADLNLAKFEKFEVEAFEEKISLLEKKQKQELENLKKIYDQNCENWVRDIVSNTLSE